MERFTRKNPNGTYRVPFTSCKSFRMENDRLNGAFFGDFIDKLGKIEELELDIELIEKLSAVPEKKLKEFLKTI